MSAPPLVFGVALPQIFLDAPIDPGAVKAYAQQAEALGFHSLWVQEQTLGRVAVLESLTLLTFAAAVTRTIRLGPAVLIVPLRNPVHLAKQLATLDQLSGGRLIVGVGLGENRRIYPAFGITAEQRVARFVEGVRVMQRLWTEPRVTFDGRFTRLDDAAMEPKPLQGPRLPIWFGVRVPEALGRAVELGDGWMGAGSSTPADFQEQAATLRGLLASAGRDPATFPFAKRIYLAIERDRAHAMERLRTWFGRYYGRAEMADRMAVGGTVAECAEVVRRFRAAGAGMVLLNPVYEMERHLDLFVKELIPAVG